MNITGKIKVKAKVNEWNGSISYRTVLSNKRQDGETEFMSIFINLVKDAKNKPIDNDSYINVKSGFLTFSKDKEGKDILRIVISDFDYEEEMQGNESFNAGETYDDGLPF